MFGKGYLEKALFSNFRHRLCLRTIELVAICGFCEASTKSPLSFSGVDLPSTRDTSSSDTCSRGHYRASVWDLVQGTDSIRGDHQHILCLRVVPYTGHLLVPLFDLDQQA